MKKRDPSLLKQVWDVYSERYRVHRALRLLKKQEWSVEFLTAMLIRAANMVHKPLEMTIIGPGGTRIIINTLESPTPIALQDESIFNHLDDEMKIRSFISEANKR